MQICGRRASSYSQISLAKMLLDNAGPDGETLTAEQRREMKKVYDLRKRGEAKNYGYKTRIYQNR